MGIDWIRMTIKVGVSPEDLSHLVHVQAESFYWSRLWQTSFDEDIEPVGEGKENDARNVYRTTSDRLKSYLEIAKKDEIGDFPPSYRTYIVTRNRIFPREWRIDAYRTYLPGDLVEQLAIWEKHIQQVRSGRYHEYLLHVYLYEMSAELYRYWQLLRETADKTWAQKAQPSIAELKERILQMPQPTRYRYPDWEEWKGRPDKGDYQRDSSYQNFSQEKQTLSELTTAWNSVVSPKLRVGQFKTISGSGLKEWYEYLPTFEDYVNEVYDPDLDEFLSWVKRCYDEGMGLFLDY